MNSNRAKTYKNPIKNRLKREKKRLSTAIACIQQLISFLPFTPRDKRIFRLFWCFDHNSFASADVMIIHHTIRIYTSFVVTKRSSRNNFVIYIRFDYMTYVLFLLLLCCFQWTLHPFVMRAFLHWSVSFLIPLFLNWKEKKMLWTNDTNSDSFFLCCSSFLSVLRIIIE